MTKSVTDFKLLISFRIFANTVNELWFKQIRFSMVSFITVLVLSLLFSFCIFLILLLKLCISAKYFIAFSLQYLLWYLIFCFVFFTFFLMAASSSHFFTSLISKLWIILSFSETLVVWCLSSDWIMSVFLCFGIDTGMTLSQ